VLVNANRELWEKGDFTRIAAVLRGSGEALVAGLGIGKGTAMLDLGCGDGTTAVPAARLGAEVLGVDIAANLLAAGQARAAAEKLDNLRFGQGDASDLSGLEDDRFDLVLSVFGAMFAPRPEDVAKEMVRVAKPGGRVVMANWIAGDPTLVAEVLRISSSYSPLSPEGFVSPMLWGDPDVVTARFGGAGVPAERISCDCATWNFEYEGTPAELVGIYRDYYGPTMDAFAAATAAGREDELRAELDELFAGENRAVDGTSIAATFLLVNVMCPQRR
jgi:SAM-dependent methyltransferase